MRPALLVLPGVTADSPKRRFLRSYLESHSACAVHLPSLWQGLGLAWSARQLATYIAGHLPPSQERPVHCLAYISGGLILRHMQVRQPYGRWGRIVWVRAPIQEQVPTRLFEKYGRLPVLLSRGWMMHDLATASRHPLPFPQTGQAQGLILERGVSRLAAELGLVATDFERLLPTLHLPQADETLAVSESHDDAYTSPRLLDQVIHFVAEGRFVSRT